MNSARTLRWILVVAIALVVAACAISSYFVLLSRVERLEDQQRIDREAPVSFHEHVTSMDVQERVTEIHDRLNQLASRVTAIENSIQRLGEQARVELSHNTISPASSDPLLDLPDGVFAFDDLPRKVKLQVQEKRNLSPGTPRADLFFLSPDGLFSFFLMVPSDDPDILAAGAESLEVFSDIHTLQNGFLVRAKYEGRFLEFDTIEEAKSHAELNGILHPHFEMRSPPDKGFVLIDLKELRLSSRFRELEESMDELIDATGGYEVTGPEPY